MYKAATSDLFLDTDMSFLRTTISRISALSLAFLTIACADSNGTNVREVSDFYDQETFDFRVANHYGNISICSVEITECDSDFSLVLLVDVDPGTNTHIKNLEDGCYDFVAEPCDDEANYVFERNEVYIETDYQWILSGSDRIEIDFE